MGSLLLHVFGVGKVPDAVRAEIATETVLFEAEGITVLVRFSGKVPGRRARRSITRGIGSLVVTDQRVIACWRDGRVIDLPLDSLNEDATATITLDAEGAHVIFDLNRMHPTFEGEVRVDFRAEIPEQTLSQLAHRVLTLPGNPQAVLRLLGVRRPLPAP